MGPDSRYHVAAALIAAVGGLAALLVLLRGLSGDDVRFGLFPLLAINLGVLAAAIAAAAPPGLTTSLAKGVLVAGVAAALLGILVPQVL